MTTLQSHRTVRELQRVTASLDVLVDSTRSPMLCHCQLSCPSSSFRTLKHSECLFLFFFSLICRVGMTWETFVSLSLRSFLFVAQPLKPLLLTHALSQCPRTFPRERGIHKRQNDRKIMVIHALERAR